MLTGHEYTALINDITDYMVEDFRKQGCADCVEWCEIFQISGGVWLGEASGTMKRGQRKVEP